jgi:hypothetical protein
LGPALCCGGPPGSADQSSFRRPLFYSEWRGRRPGLGALGRDYELAAAAFAESKRDMDRQGSSRPHLGAERRKPLGPQADRDAIGADIDSLDEKLDDSRLLGGEKFVPQGIELFQRFAHLGLGDVAVPLGCNAESPACWSAPSFLPGTPYPLKIDSPLAGGLGRKRILLIEGVTAVAKRMIRSDERRPAKRKSRL